jgi:hypothetical protein
MPASSSLKKRRTKATRELGQQPLLPRGKRRTAVCCAIATIVTRLCDAQRGATRFHILTCFMTPTILLGGRDTRGKQFEACHTAPGR